MSYRGHIGLALEVFGGYALAVSFGLASGIGTGVDAQSRVELYQALARGDGNPYGGVFGKLVEPLLYHVQGIRYEYAWYAYQRQDALTSSIHDPIAYATFGLFLGGLALVFYGVLYACDMVPSRRDLVYLWRSIGPQKYFKDQ